VPVFPAAADSGAGIRASLLRVLALGVAAATAFGFEYRFLIARNTSPALYQFWAPRRGIPIALLSAGGRLVKLLPLGGPPATTAEPAAISAGAVAMAMALAAIALTGLVLACLRIRRGRRKWLEIQVLCLAPCLAAIAAHAASQYPVSPRTSLFLLPFLVTLLTSSLQLIGAFVSAAFKQPWLRPSVQTALIVLMIATIVIGVRNVPVSELVSPFEDVESAVSFLRGRVQRDDLLWVHASMSESFTLYKRMSGWSDPPAVFGQTGWGCCPRGVDATQGMGSEESVRRDIDNTLPAGRGGRIWLLYTTRAGLWAFVGQDESLIVKAILRQRGCSESGGQTFYNVGIGLFDCGRMAR
jgi:hypothetical protein